MLIVYHIANHPDSYFDVVVSGVVPLQTLVHDDSILPEVIRILKPNGTFAFQEVVVPLSTPGLPVKTESWLKSHLKINGFVAADEVRHLL